MSSFQWRIQDLPDGGGGTNIQSGGTNLFIILAIFSPNTEWKWKKLDPEEECLLS